MKYLSRPEELVLLTIWKMKEEPYGVNIRKYIIQMTGKYWSIGAIYIPLDRLENKGFLSSHLAEYTSERGGKSKRYYELTKEGLKQLEEIRKIYQVFWKDLPELSLK
ncbi:MAG: PadR family transcriptional regulator [Candidatus Aminicenantes bacterium]|nr:PadR family transcriptional regulator [Candidatus Aminicenantes bacterium]